MEEAFFPAEEPLSHLRRGTCRSGPLRTTAMASSIFRNARSLHSLARGLSSSPNDVAFRRFQQIQDLAKASTPRPSRVSIGGRSSISLRSESGSRVNFRIARSVKSIATTISRFTFGSSGMRMRSVSAAQVAAGVQICGMPRLGIHHERDERGNGKSHQYWSLFK